MCHPWHHQVLTDCRQRYKTLRIWITNTVDDQPWQANNSLSLDSFDFPASLESSYRVKIEGRLLDEEDDADKDDEDDAGEEVDSADKMDTDAASKQKQQKPVSAKPGQRYRFSHFFKMLTVDFDRKRAIPGIEMSVEWKKPDKTPASSNLPAAADFDELTFKRNGDENQNITINLYRHEDDRFEVSPDLADIIDMREATRQEATMGMWEYIKLMNLQEDEEKRNFRCDELLRKVRLPLSEISTPTTTSLTRAGHKPRCGLYTRPPRLRDAAPQASRADQTPVHDPRRRGVPQGPAAHRLRRPRAGQRAGEGEDGLHPQPAVRGHAEGGGGAGRPARAAHPGGVGLEGQAHLLHVHGDRSGQLCEALAQLSEARSRGHHGRGYEGRRRGRGGRRVEEGREG
jgi:chromatin remodeling complex protein RSC6